MINKIRKDTYQIRIIGNQKIRINKYVKIRKDTYLLLQIRIIRINTKRYVSDTYLRDWAAVHTGDTTSDQMRYQ